MTEYAFILTLPCDHCPDRFTVRAEPPYDTCRRFGLGMEEPLDEMTAKDCDKLAAVEELSDLAVAVSRARFRHTPAAVRAQAIGSFADTLTDWASDIGAEFDADGWVAVCGEEMQP